MAAISEPLAAEAQALLDFWFGDATDDVEVATKQASLWWSKKPEVDATLAERFGDLCERARNGELESWKETPRGRLAVIVAIDQLSRNIHRESADAFSEDRRALRLSIEGVEAGDDLHLRPIERVFLYMPLMHAEDIGAQAKSVELFERLLQAVPESQKKVFEGNLRFAIAHRDIVQRFGRFPHRNGVLERTSTAEELEFLTQPGSSF
jgi:uncharacterized protein (DUF924 family)